MDKNPVCGVNGKYTIDGKTNTDSKVPFKILSSFSMKIETAS